MEQAGVHGRAYAVDVGPGTELILRLVLLRRGETRRVGRTQRRRIVLQGLARRAEIQQHRIAVHAQVDVGRLDVEMQEALRMDFAQAVEQAREHHADELLADIAAVLHHMLAQGAAAFVLHHHVDGRIGAEKIEHAHHIRMIEAGQ